MSSPTPALCPIRGVFVTHMQSYRHVEAAQKKRHQMKMIMNKPKPPMGPYCNAVSHGLHMAKRQSTHLLQQQLPIDPHRRLLVLATVFSQARRDIAHALQTVPSVQQVLNVLGHDLGHILQLIIQLV